MIKLRPHHLLCMLTYIGKGYTTVFTENFTALMQEINAGAKDIEIVQGIDDICATRINNPLDSDCHCYEDRIQDRDTQAMSDLGISYGDIITLSREKLAKMREDFKTGKIRTACQSCQWQDLCTTVAKQDYKESILKA